jgi:hypothetical protein
MQSGRDVKPEKIPSSPMLKCHHPITQCNRQSMQFAPPNLQFLKWSWLTSRKSTIQEHKNERMDLASTQQTSRRRIPTRWLCTQLCRFPNQNTEIENPRFRGISSGRGALPPGSPHRCELYRRATKCNRHQYVDIQVQCKNHRGLHHR